MGTSAGPSLQGIGRGGDSNLVLEMDAHDAKSYPGEPTSNIFYNPNNWTGSDWTSSSGTIANNAAEGPNGGSAGSITAVSADPYIYSGAVHSVAVGSFTFSCWVKGVGSSVGKSGDMRVNFSVGTATGSDPAYVNYTLTDQWQRVSILATATGAGTIQVGLEPPNSAAVGDVVYLADAQLEQKGYASPFVREGKGGTGTYNARPASVNLMIHGNVGTGTSFEDSSPEKNVLTTINSLGHGGVSKFSGGSLGKFTRGSSQYIEVASTDAANFGTGDWTVDYWFNMTSGQTDRMHAINIGTYATSNLSFNFNDGNAFWLYWNGSGTPNIIFGSDGDYGDGAWHHMAVTRASGMIRIWVDGVHKGSNNYNSSISMGATTTIGVGGPSPYWDGYLDEVRITKGTALWVGSGNFTPPTRRNLSAPVVDRSGNHNGGNFNTKDMTDVATYRVGEVIRPIGNAVWDFDGTDDIIHSYDINEATGTLAIWMKSNFSGTYSYPFGKQKGTETLAMSMHSTNSPAYSGDFWVRQTGGTYGSVQTNASLADGVWHQVVCMWGVGGLKIYVDGELNDTHAFAGHGNATSGDADLGIGCLLNASDVANYATPMQAASVNTWSIQLTAQQVIENFNQQRNRFNI